MITIRKFSLRTLEVQEIDMPLGAELLTVQIQNEVPCLWARVDNKAEEAPRQIITQGAGYKLSSKAKRYIGTYQMSEGMLVLHVFDSI